MPDTLNPDKPNFNTADATYVKSSCAGDAQAATTTSPAQDRPSSWKEWATGIAAPFSLLVFAGLVKNAGKTTSLNSFNALFQNEALGMTSIGYDGEALDAIYRHPKPPIKVYPGQLVLTAEKFLPADATFYEVIESYGNHSQYGSWLILRALTSSDFRMAGPSSLPELRDAIKRLHRHGAKRLHIDGALNRLSHLSLPGSGVILSTGAALGSTLEQVTERTLQALEFFQLPLTWAELEPVIPIEQSAYFRAGKWHQLPKFLWTENLRQLLPEGVESLYLSGALTDKLYNLLREAKRLPQHLIVNTPAQILLSAQVWQGLKARGIVLALRKPPSLLMLTLSPWHPMSPIPTEELAAALLLYSHVPLVDIQREKIWFPGGGSKQ